MEVLGSEVVAEADFVPDVQAARCHEFFHGIDRSQPCVDDLGDLREVIVEHTEVQRDE